MRNAVLVALAVSGPTACRAGPAPVIPTPAVPASVAAPSKGRHELCELAVTSPVPSDGDVMRRAARRAESSISSVLGPSVVTQCAAIVRCTTFVMPFETCNAKPGLATTLTTYESDTRGAAAIFILAPSKHPATFQSAVGSGANESYFEKLTTHEVAGVFLDCATRLKGAGWRFFSAPAWFYQGIEEYLGIRAISDAAARADYWKRYVSAVAAHASSIDLTDSVKVVETYQDGALLVAYLWHRLGRNGIGCILQSKAAEFGEAKRACGFNGWDGFREWLGKTPSMPT